MRVVPVIQGQNLFDICIQEYGDVSYIFQLLTDNPTLNINSNVSAGQTVLIDETVAGEPDVKAFFTEQKRRRIYPVNYSDFVGGSYSLDYNDDYDIND